MSIPVIIGSTATVLMMASRRSLGVEASLLFTAHQSTQPFSTALRSAASRAEIEGSGADVGAGVPVEPDVDECVPEVNWLVAGSEAVDAGELVVTVLLGSERGDREFTVELTVTVDAATEGEPGPDGLAPEPDT
ncbi:MAG: hypothetical protein M3Y77_11050 [Actinomycetota bacterium]|nr:hypothetical protein [Actinomycetota bacterium]